MKTNRGAKKRFKFAKNGKIRRNKANKRHLLTAKSTKVKRHARGTTTLTDGDARLVRRLIPYGRK